MNEKMMELIKSRHSVRQYLDKPIEEETRISLNECIKEVNEKSGMNIQVIYDDPKCFSSFMAHYGNFRDCSNYICMVAKKKPDLEEEVGYFGEIIVLKAQELGLNTCWVALTYGKTKCVIEDDEKLYCVISLGYGKTQGVNHKNKLSEKLSDVSNDSPEWFKEGVEAAMLAPTAINQQKFYISYNNGEPTIKTLKGPYSKMDTGIIKYHFEVITGTKLK